LFTKMKITLKNICYKKMFSCLSKKNNFVEKILKITSHLKYVRSSFFKRKNHFLKNDNHLKNQKTYLNEKMLKVFFFFKK